MLPDGTKLLPQTMLPYKSIIVCHFIDHINIKHEIDYICSCAVSSNARIPRPGWQLRLNPLSAASPVTARPVFTVRHMLLR